MSGIIGENGELLSASAESGIDRIVKDRPTGDRGVDAAYFRRRAGKGETPW